MALRESKLLLAIGGVLCVSAGFFLVALATRRAPTPTIAGPAAPLVNTDARPSPPAPAQARWEAPRSLEELAENQLTELLQEASVNARATEWVARALTTAPAPTAERVLSRFSALSDQTVTMGLLERNAERFKDHLAVMSGEVAEIRENFTPDHLTFTRVAIDNQGLNRVLGVFSQPGTVPENIVAGSRVRVYGVLYRRYTYQSQAGHSIQIPRMDSVAFVRIGGR